MILNSIFKIIFINGMFNKILNKNASTGIRIQITKLRVWEIKLLSYRSVPRTGVEPVLHSTEEYCGRPLRATVTLTKRVSNIVSHF